MEGKLGGHHSFKANAIFSLDNMRARICSECRKSSPICVWIYRILSFCRLVLRTTPSGGLAVDALGPGDGDGAAAAADIVLQQQQQISPPINPPNSHSVSFVQPISVLL